MAKTATKPKKGDKKEAPPEPSGPRVPPRLQTKYHDEIAPALAKQLGRENRLSLPRLEKIVVNMGVGSAVTEKKHMEEAVAALTQITGQKPSIRRARKAISNSMEMAIRAW